MKTIKVKMTHAQAARFEKLAGALNTTPGEFLKIFALGSLDGWGTLGEFLETWPGERDFYATEAHCMISPAIEDELASLLNQGKPIKRGGLRHKRKAAA